ncbi:MAG: hypothetical protein Q4E69_03970 [Bacilli bacterium]|nr:hypothetical protein [Bacilli bacterium]
MGYYLIAMNKTSNEFNILGLKSKWYLKNGTDILSRSNKLEVIDLVTTRFKSREEMANRLVENNYIPNNNYDFFIVSKYKNKGVEKLKFQEVIYNRKSSRINDLRVVAYNSLNRKIKCSENELIINKFITKADYSNVYSRIVNDRLTGIPYNFIEDFRKVRASKSNPYTLKYKSSNCLENYGLSRSIVDSFNRFDDLKGEDTYKNHIMYFKKQNTERMKIYKDLLEVCDKNYVEGQLSLFDIPVTEEPNVVEKRKYVLDYLKNIGLSRFSINDKKGFINIDDLVEYMSIDESKILSKGLNTRVLRAAYLYNLHTAKLNSAGQTFGNFQVLQEDINADAIDLKKSLNDDKIVERTYDFCKCFDTVLRKSLGEEVKSYQKRGNKK